MCAPVIDDVVCFVADTDLSGEERRAMVRRDEEAEWYHSGFTEFTDDVEMTPMLRHLGAVDGPVLDHGAGTGRMTARLARQVRQPVVAVDYSLESLRRLRRVCDGLDVLAVQADVRTLPFRSDIFAAATSGGVYCLFRSEDRAKVADELFRVMRPGATASLSSLNYSWVFRLWRLRGNRRAREGEQLHGTAGYYVRQTPSELRRELGRVFAVDQVIGLRNLPTRTLTAMLGRAVGATRAERVFVRCAPALRAVDRAIGRSPLAGLAGFLLCARLTKDAAACATVEHAHAAGGSELA